MGDSEILVLGGDTSPERSARLVERRPGRLLRLLIGHTSRPQVQGNLYWPLDLAVATAEVKLALRSFRTVAVPIARDAVTGQHGIVDQPLIERKPWAAPHEELVAGVVVGDDEEWWEFGRNQVVRRFRPTQIHNLRFEEQQRVYLPYHLVRAGDTAFLVDRMTGNLDRLHHHRSVQMVSGYPLVGVAHGGDE